MVYLQFEKIGAQLDHMSILGYIFKIQVKIKNLKQQMKGVRGAHLILHWIRIEAWRAGSQEICQWMVRSTGH